MTLVFVPTSTEQAQQLWQGTPPAAPIRAFSTTPALLAALDYTAEMAEDAEYAAMVLASVDGLCRHGERVVLVAEVPEGDVAENPDELDNGGVLLAGLSKAAVQSFFTDDPATELADARAAARDLTIDQVWETEQVQALLAQSDLLWHSVEELAAIGQG